MTYTCSACGDAYTEAIAKLAEHVWDDGVITLEPTVEAEGVKTYTCECGATKTEAVAKLTPPATTEAITTEEVTTEVSVTTEDPTATTAETTAETANSDGCNASAALSAIAIMPMLVGGVLILRRRKED